MYKSILLSAALVASTAYAGTPGKAIVINGCNYPVHLSSVPAQFGGYETTDQVLQPKQSYTQQWTELTNKAGWSIKLAKEAGAKSIMQYEYTFHNDGIIWYDLSCVDGNPWDKNWEITAAGDKNCSPRQAAYRYATDDAYGMQSCSSDASLTVTLCSGESQNDGLVSSVASVQSAGATLELSSPVAAPTTSTPAPAPAPTSPTTAAPASAETGNNDRNRGHGDNGRGQGGNFYNANNKVDTPTTLATAKSSPFAVVAAKKEGEDGDVFTVYQTVVETAYAYETYVPGKRHVHHPDHPQFR